MCYNDERQSRRMRVAFVIAIVYMLMIGLKVYGQPPKFVVESKLPPFVVVSKLTPTVTRDTIRASDGLLYEQHADGVYRLVPNQPQASVPVREVTGSRPFQDNTTPVTIVPHVGVRNTLSVGTTPIEPTIMYALPVGQVGGTNCTSYG